MIHAGFGSTSRTEETATVSIAQPDRLPLTPGDRPNMVPPCLPASKRSSSTSHGGASTFPAILGISVIAARSEEHTSELQSLMRTSYAVFSLKHKKHSNKP